MSGVFRAFESAIGPGLQVTEVGQSVTGKLLQNVVRTRPVDEEMRSRFGKDGVYDALAWLTKGVVHTGGYKSATYLHLLDHHSGNRRLLAAPTLTGMHSEVTQAGDR